MDWGQVPSGPEFGVVRKTLTRRSGRLNGRALRSARLIALEMAVVAPIPSARHRIADSETVGARMSPRAALRISVVLMNAIVSSDQVDRLLGQYLLRKGWLFAVFGRLGMSVARERPQPRSTRR